MHNDDITRLAGIMASAIKYAGPDGDIAVYKVEYWESELRQLAQQGKAGDHIEDKLVMVPAHSPEAGVRACAEALKRIRDYAPVGGDEWLTAVALLQSWAAAALTAALEPDHAE